MSLRPPLNALHVFCVVVQEGGFRQAALALHLTPGAVSRQIQTLEAHLKQVLFDRGLGSSATLTAQGRHLQERVGDKMAAINDVLDPGGRVQRQGSILVDTSVTLAMHWLIPQLADFRKRYLHIHVQIRTVDGNINPSSPADVFLRRDVSELRGLPAQTFMQERSVLVSSPEFMSNLPPGRSADMRWLSGVARIGARSRPDLWAGWSTAHGMDAKPLEPTFELDNTVLAIEAAKQGLGALVVPAAFISTMLQSNALQLLHATAIDSGSYSFAIGRHQASSRVAIFTDWLKAQGAPEITPASLLKLTD